MLEEERKDLLLFGEATDTVMGKDKRGQTVRRHQHGAVLAPKL